MLLLKIDNFLGEDMQKQKASKNLIYTDLCDGVTTGILQHFGTVKQKRKTV